MSLISEPMLLACCAFIVGSATPGPATLLIATTSMRFGRNVGLTSALGVLTGSLIWGLLAGFGVSAVLGVATIWDQAFRTIGGLYLIWLAIKSARCALSETAMCKTEDISIIGARTFGQGLLLHLSNPNAVLSWLAAIAIGTSSEASSLGSTFLLVAVCWGIAAVIYCGYASIFAQPRSAAFYETWRQKIDLVAAMLFGATAFALFTVASP